ncbi:Rieske 2Fe-2S domain-containing protein [Kitasatospora mediocidica]|uniref:Rieske 2Fe-2S domain-containing protein n=1 Tax=Kitasatospora mediocidica TaxID=58352 RepID=UPI00068FB0A1|nr:Rieske 2Fe-2S domain-containing protein [Kitasatospora mediocidica]
MPVLTFAVSGPGNCVEVGGVPYVYARTAQGGSVIRASCPHRGGPLHLATPDPTGRQLVCPWHERGTSLGRLRKEIPAVRRGSVVTAVIPGDPGSTVVHRHLPLSPGLSVGCREQF